MYEQQIKEIAERLHGLRDALELTQEQAAEKLGIEAEKYVAYESGNCDIPMSFLYSVAKGFNVDMQTLISGEDTHEVPYSVVRSGKGVVVKRKSPYVYQSLVGTFKNASGSPFLVTAKPMNGDEAFSLNTHDSDELDLVIEGTLLVKVEDSVERLEAGDSIYFNARKPHGMKPVGDKTVKFLSIAL